MKYKSRRGQEAKLGRAWDRHLSREWERHQRHQEDRDAFTPEEEAPHCQGGPEGNFCGNTDCVECYDKMEMI